MRQSNGTLTSNLYMSCCFKCPVCVPKSVQPQRDLCCHVEPRGKRCIMRSASAVHAELGFDVSFCAFHVLVALSLPLLLISPALRVRPDKLSYPVTINLDMHLQRVSKSVSCDSGLFWPVFCSVVSASRGASPSTLVPRLGSHLYFSCCDQQRAKCFLSLLYASARHSYRSTLH